MSSARALAPAKVNLWLDVLGRREDGFHELDTGMLALDLEDELVAERTERGAVELAVSGPFATADVPTDGRNLAVRAAEQVLAAARAAGEVGPEAGLALRLDKRIPSGAGLGGGSSDAAAAVLVASHVLVGPGRLDRERARGWLAALGSDCVFFLEAAATGFARCLGRGEQVEPLPLEDEDWTVALLAPDLEVPTAAVYARLAAPPVKPGSSRPAGRKLRLTCPERDLRAGVRNGLEDAALVAAPALRDWRRLLDQHAGSHFQLSGSGSTYFGLFRDGDRARSSLDELARAATDAGLAVRGRWLARPAGRGAAVVPRE